MGFFSFVNICMIWVFYIYLYRVNGIDFEEVRVDISKRQQLSPEFKGMPISKWDSNRRNQANQSD